MEKNRTPSSPESRKRPLQFAPGVAVRVTMETTMIDGGRIAPAGDLNIVKVLGPDGEFLFEVRCSDVSGLERVISCYSNLQDAEQLLLELSKLDPNVRHAAMALESIYALARKIARSSEEQGTPDYATKSHMRSWGRQAWRIAEDALVMVWGPTAGPSRGGDTK